VPNRVADVFDGFADFASRFSEAFLHVTACAVRRAFGLEIAIVDRAADYFFRLAFSLIEFAFEFVFIW
jgi:hypothetical protein